MKPSTQFLLLTLILLLALPACIPGPKVTVLEGDERDQVLAYSEAMADNLLAAMNAADYSAFSRDLSDATAKAINEQEFQKMLDLLTPKIGAYQSRQVDRVEQVGDNVAVIYTATFEKEDGVTIRLVFSSAEPHQIVGLWFDSPNLRKK